MMLQQIVPSLATETHRSPKRLRLLLLTCLLMGLNPLPILASEANTDLVTGDPITLETGPSELSEAGLVDPEACLSSPSEPDDSLEITASEKVLAESEGQTSAIEPCSTTDAALDPEAEDEFADAGEEELPEEAAPPTSGPAINVNINIGSEGPLIGIGSASNGDAYGSEDDFGELPDPGLEDPIEEGLSKPPVGPKIPVGPIVPAGPKVIAPVVVPHRVVLPAKAPKGLIRKQKRSSPKKMKRLRPSSRQKAKGKRVKPGARRVKSLGKRINPKRRRIKPLGKRINPNRRRIKSQGRRIRPALRRSPAKRRQFRRIMTPRPLMRSMPRQR